MAKKKSKSKKKDSDLVFELIGGIYVVERFPDGTEKREEIDGEVVLKLMVSLLERHLDQLALDEKLKS